MMKTTSPHIYHLETNGAAAASHHGTSCCSAKSFLALSIFAILSASSLRQMQPSFTNYMTTIAKVQHQLQQQQHDCPCNQSSDIPITNNSNTVLVLFNASESNQWKRELMARLDRIRLVCGDLCNINDRESFESRIVNSSDALPDSLPRLQVPNVDCDAIIGSADIDAGDTTFPSTLPEDLLPYYTIGGMMTYGPKAYYKAEYLGGQAMTTNWSMEDLEKQKQESMGETPTLQGTYGPGATLMVREKIRKLNLTNASVLVIGSEKPWVEAICLGLGAAMVTTLEYGSIRSTHPQVKTLTPTEFRERYQAGTLGMFDVIVSHSSLEHSGLGRYGDALNPWGDILAVARAWCVTKPGGGMYLGLPTARQDDILYNAHRVYGKARWPLVTTNWKEINEGVYTEYWLGKGMDRVAQGSGVGFVFRKVEAGQKDDIAF